MADAKEPPYPPGPQSDTGGVLPMNLEGRFKEQRERLAGGFTDKDRAWRAQWLKDQELHPDEPIIPPNYYKELYNPIRRWASVPLDVAFKPFKNVMGSAWLPARHITGRLCMWVVVVYSAYYYSKYCAGDWTRRGGWRMIYNPGRVYPGEKDFPSVSQRTKPSEYGLQLTPENCPL